MGVAGDAVDCELHNRILEVTAKITDKTTQEAVRLLLSLIRSVKSNLVRTLEEDYVPTEVTSRGPPTRQRSEPPQIPPRARPTPPSARPPMWMRVNGGSTAGARAGQAEGKLVSPTSSPTPPPSKGGTPSVAEHHQFAGTDHGAESPEGNVVPRIQAPTEERTGLAIRRRLEVRAKTGGAITWTSPRTGPTAVYITRSPFQSGDSALEAHDAAKERGCSPRVAAQLSESGVPRASVRRNSWGTVPCAANSGGWEEAKASTMGALPAYTSPRRQHRPAAVWAKVHMRRGGTPQTTEDGLRQLLKLAQGNDNSQTMCGGAAAGGDLKGVHEMELGPPAAGQRFQAAHHEGKASTLDVLPMWLQQR